eukprot:10002493-Prorocentrum_lima.AAC.1
MCIRDRANKAEKSSNLASSRCRDSRFCRKVVDTLAACSGSSCPCSARRCPAGAPAMSKLPSSSLGS